MHPVHRLLALTLTAFALGACGGGSADNPQPTVESTAPEPTGPPRVSELIERIAQDNSMDGIDGLEDCSIETEPPFVQAAAQTPEAGQLVCGTAANDRIEGGGGADIVIGGDGNDVLFAAVEGDTNITADSTEVLIGGPGDDKLVDAYGPGIVFAGAGNDLVQVADPAAEFVDCGPGIDTVEVASVGTPDELVDCENIEYITIDPRTAEAAKGLPQ